MPLGSMVCGERLFVQPDWVFRLQCWRWSECVGVAHRQLERGGPGQLCTGIRCSVHACECARLRLLVLARTRVRVRARACLLARLRVQRARSRLRVQRARDKPRPQRVTSGSRRSGAQAAGPPAAIAQEKQVRAPAPPPRLPLLPGPPHLSLAYSPAVGSVASASARGNPAAPSRPPFGQRVQAALNSAEERLVAARAGVRHDNAKQGCKSTHE